MKKTEVVLDIVEVYAKYFSNKEEHRKINRFLSECLELNKDQIVYAIATMKDENPMFIIETFAFNILANIYIKKSQSELIELIAGGSIFNVKDLLVKKFLCNEEIRSEFLLRQVG